MAVRNKRRFEDQEQAAFFTWLRIRHPLAYEHAYHVPNGGSRGGGDRRSAQIEGARLKAQGVKAGVPDIWIPLRRGAFAGLVVEFKATPPHDAEVSKEQQQWVLRMKAQGWRSEVVLGLNALRRLIDEYMSLPAGEVCHG